MLMGSQKNDDRERRGKTREPQHSPLIVAPSTLGTVSSSAHTFSHLSVCLFSCITQTFKCSQCPECTYFPSYPRVIISVHIFLSLCLFSHCWVVLLCSEGYALSIGYFLGVLFSQFDLREVSHLLACSLSLPFSFQFCTKSLQSAPSPYC